MKISLSKKWQYEMKTLFCIETIVIIAVLLSRNDIMIKLFLLVWIIAVMSIIEVVLFCLSFRFFTYTLCKEYCFESYLLKKRLCIIDKTKPIYYVVFEGVEGYFSRKQYIVISNEPFEYEETSSFRIFPWDKKPLLVSYDVKKHIAMPFDKKTETEFELDKWQSVGGRI